MKKEVLKINKKPWPTKEAMVQVYDKNLWGNNDTPFYSGEGSHAPYIITPYIKAVTTFLKSFKNPITVCDLGCGDFNGGMALVQFSKKFTAVDIVPNLIAFNKTKFEEENLAFQCLDISKEKLPKADCAIIRQVLQHLSNAEILKVVNKLSQYKYVILTEHIPNGAFEYNKDIISGQGTRLKKGSGVVLTEPPFNFNILEEKELVGVDLGDGNGIIVTTLYKS